MHATPFVDYLTSVSENPNGKTSRYEGIVLGQLSCRREAPSTCDAIDRLTDLQAFPSIYLP
jgi:hypothetical protein